MSEENTVYKIVSAAQGSGAHRWYERLPGLEKEFPRMVWEKSQKIEQELSPAAPQHHAFQGLSQGVHYSLHYL
ncbi:hypothetical protein Q0590_34345 [Rhodocytophaga aerolata]|uniref:Uncharacterized protein n=1 Tax=Rhodocytophaga aerolata TaxID=455078 RepID=A0ABT8RKJ1_9BACT|nr:hypothetical protein [Rhodocytophaga aerolata]MDO1451407.1 hypothetical protein [Rhodocytophaga aerolata]